MMRFARNKKGMTLIDVIVALAVLAIASMPLLTVFANSAMLIKKADTRLEINAITRVVKENVVNSVKFGVGNVIYSYDAKKDIDLNTDINGTSLQIKGKDGQVNGKYKFDAIRTIDFGDIKNPDDMINPAAMLSDTCEYRIDLKKMDGTEVQKIKIYINRLQP
jgi:prepilin-type N-terminal cleavage/methylation domain-containing protein